MTVEIDGYTLTVKRDDRGRLIAEVCHTASGKTVGSEQVDNYEMARWWGGKLVNSFPKGMCD